MAYAKSKEDKQKKRNVLLDEVYRQFSKKSFEDIRIIDVAKGCKMAKGTVFNYFDSKETLFLVLLSREYGKWFDGLYQHIERNGPYEAGGLQKTLLAYIEKTVEKDRRLHRLIGLGHSHLEHNVSLRLAEQYRRFINDNVTRLGVLIASKDSQITAVQGIKLMMTIHTVFVGHIQMSILPGIMEKALALDELEAYEVDFKVSVIETLKVYMNGLFKR